MQNTRKNKILLHITTVYSLKFIQYNDYCNGHTRLVFDYRIPKLLTCTKNYFNYIYDLYTEVIILTRYSINNYNGLKCL